MATTHEPAPSLGEDNKENKPWYRKRVVLALGGSAATIGLAASAWSARLAYDVSNALSEIDPNGAGSEISAPQVPGEEVLVEEEPTLQPFKTDLDPSIPIRKPEVVTIDPSIVDLTGPQDEVFKNMDAINYAANVVELPDDVEAGAILGLIGQAGEYAGLYGMVKVAHGADPEFDAEGAMRQHVAPTFAESHDSQLAAEIRRAVDEFFASSPEAQAAQEEGSDLGAVSVEVCPVGDGIYDGGPISVFCDPEDPAGIGMTNGYSPGTSRLTDPTDAANGDVRLMMGFVTYSEDGNMIYTPAVVETDGVPAVGEQGQLIIADK